MEKDAEIKDLLDHILLLNGEAFLARLEKETLAYKQKVDREAADAHARYLVTWDGDRRWSNHPEPATPVEIQTFGFKQGYRKNRAEGRVEKVGKTLSESEKIVKRIAAKYRPVNRTDPDLYGSPSSW